MNRPVLSRANWKSLLAVTCCLTGLSDLSHTLRANEQQSLRQVLKAATSGRRYRPPTLNELTLARKLFVNTLLNPDQPELVDEWRRLGFHLVRLDDPVAPIWMIAERPKQKRGGGFYLIRPTYLPGMALQAPHSHSDNFTGLLALQLFQEGQVGAAAWNTVPRSHFDVAHQQDHFYSQFTQALIHAYPESSVIQLHGFVKAKRQTTAGRAADVIVSDGTRAPRRSVRQLAIQLQQEVVFGNVLLFPTQVGELGATTNLQGEILRQSGNSRFLHLEVSPHLRLHLVSDPDSRRVLLKNLAGYVD